MAFYHFYYTPQFVAINDTRLGPLAFILTLLVLINSIFSILVYKGYLEYETPRGVLQFDLTHQHSLSLQNTTYCEKELCAIRDEKEVLVETGPDSVMITTYVEEFEEERICDHKPKHRSDVNNEECPEVWKTVSQTKYYIADLEDFELEVDHSMKAHRFYEATHFSPDYAKGVKDMPGVLLGNHTVIKKLKIGETDKFYIKELLKASGLHDGLSEEQRQQGVHLQVDLHYGNARCDGSMYCWFGTIPAEYRYRVYEVPHANFKVVDIEPSSSITHRWVKIRRGIHIQGVQGGRIGKVSMGVLMTQLATAVGMLGLVNILVDNLMCYVLPRKEVYTDWKYVVRTVDPLPPKPALPDKKDN